MLSLFKKINRKLTLNASEIEPSKNRSTSSSVFGGDTLDCFVDKFLCFFRKHKNLPSRKDKKSRDFLSTKFLRNFVFAMSRILCFFKKQRIRQRSNPGYNHTIQNLTSSSLILTTLILFTFFLIPNTTNAGSITLPPNNLGLVAYYSFEDATGTKATDFSGNGNTGTLTNMDANTDWVDGKKGKALDFDGADDYVDLTNSVLDYNINNSFSVSAWVRIEQESTAMQIVGNWDNTDNYKGIFLGVRGSGVFDFHLRQDVSNYLRKLSVNSIDDGQWHHVVATYDGSNSLSGMNVYVNNINSSSIESNGTINDINNTKATLIGSMHGDTYYFNGKIDDVRIYNRALSATEISTLYNNTKATRIQSGVSNEGLVGYWSFEDATGTTATDFSGNNITGTLTGIDGSSWVEGRFGEGIQFANYDYMTTPDPNIPSGSDFTVSVWARPSSINPNPLNGNRIINQGWSNNGAWALYFWEGTSIDFATKNSAGTRYEVTTPDMSFDLNTWYHILVTADGSNLTMYINGEQSGTPTAYTGTLFSYGGGLEFADNTTDPFEGVMDEARIYKRALSTSEITELYEGSRKTYINTSQNNKLTDGLVGLWSFNGQDLDGTTAFDRSGNGNNGTLTNGPQPTAGRIGQALDFDGSDDYIEIGDPTTFDFGSSDFSFSVWIKTTHNLSLSKIISKDSSSGRQFFLDYSATEQKLQITYFTGNLGDVYLSSPVLTGIGITLNDGNWHHIVGQRNGNSFDIYVDSAIVQTGTTSGSHGAMQSTATNMRIGNRVYSGNGNNFDGIIDEVRIYNRALSTNEIKQLYSQGR